MNLYSCFIILLILLNEFGFYNGASILPWFESETRYTSFQKRTFADVTTSCNQHRIRPTEIVRALLTKTLLSPKSGSPIFQHPIIQDHTPTVHRCQPLHSFVTSSNHRPLSYRDPRIFNSDRVISIRLNPRIPLFGVRTLDRSQLRMWCLIIFIQLINFNELKVNGVRVRLECSV